LVLALATFFLVPALVAFFLVPAPTGFLGVGSAKRKNMDCAKEPLEAAKLVCKRTNKR
jgi:hypothetical protein